VSWTRDYKLWAHVNDHTGKCVWPRLCPHPLCDDVVTDDQALWQHLVDKHGLSRSRPDAVSSRKRKHSDEPEFLECAPEHGPSSLKRSRLATLTISPRALPEPTAAGYRVDESDETLLDGCMTEAGGSEVLRSPSPSCMSIGEFSGHSSDTAVDPVSDEAIPAPTAKPPSGALDHDAVRADGQSHAAVKPIRIRLRVNPPPKRQSGTKSILRLKGPKFGKGARKGRNKAS
jgi:hypothetical protein